MTGETPRRTLSGLTPKATATAPQGNARLLRRNRQTPNPAPADPKTAQTQTPPAPAQPGPTEQPAAAAAELQGRPRPAKAGGKTKLGFYIDVDDAARLRGAAKYIPNELRAQGIDGFSALAARLIMDGLTELERTYNDGQPWPSLAPGEELPRGRRVQQ